MKRLPLFVAVFALVASSVLALGVEERVRQAAMTTYFHGITDEIAQREIGAAGVPYLLELLRDPDFERRDNVMAFLSFLAYDSDAPRLIDFLDNPPVRNRRPEEYRAKLIVPEALGRIAARGGGVALDLLRRMDDDPDTEPNLQRQVRYGLSMIGQRLDLESDGGDPVLPQPTSLDPNSTIHQHLLTYANHVDVDDPMSESELDLALASINIVIATEDDSSDTGCCVQLGRNGPGAVFGVPGDGKDVINSSSDLNSVIGNSVARVKVVDYIGYCSGPGSNIIGCGYTPGNGIVVVRMTFYENEGKLWAHEFGHNAGLGHNPSPGFIMSSGLSGINTRVSSFECNRFHAPSGAAQANPIENGVCEDDDGDAVMSSGDNCRLEANPEQYDFDLDFVGNDCDNCLFDANPDQVDCDYDGSGDVCDPQIIIPGPIREVEFTNQHDLTWHDPAFRKKIYRGSVTAQQAGWPDNHVQIGMTPTAVWTDTQTPDSGDLYYYLVTAFNSCGESP